MWPDFSRGCLCFYVFIRLVTVQLRGFSIFFLISLHLFKLKNVVLWSFSSHRKKTVLKWYAISHCTVLDSFDIC